MGTGGLRQGPCRVRVSSFPGPPQPRPPTQCGEVRGQFQKECGGCPGTAGAASRVGDTAPRAPSPCRHCCFWLLYRNSQEEPSEWRRPRRGRPPRPPAVWPASARVSAGTPHPLVLSSPSAPGPPWPPGCIPPAQAPRLQPTLAFGGLHPRPTHGRAPEAAPGSWAWGQSPGSGAAVPMCTRQLSHQKQPRSGPPTAHLCFWKTEPAPPNSPAWGRPAETRSVCSSGSDWLRAGPLPSGRQGHPARPSHRHGCLGVLGRPFLLRPQALGCGSARMGARTGWGEGRRGDPGLTPWP